MSEKMNYIKRIILYISLLFLTSCGFGDCKEASEDVLYKNQNYIYYQGLSTNTGDSTPEEPVNLTATFVTHKLIFLEWDEPLAWNGSGVGSGYLLEYSKSGQNKPQTVLRTRNETYYIIAAEIWTKYNISLTAYNNDSGKFSKSEPVFLAIGTKFTEPSEPVGLKITEVTNTSFLVTWSEPTIKNGPLSGYILNCTGSDYVFENDTSARNLTVNGLKPMQNYSVSVAAYNSDLVSNRRTGPVSVVHQQTSANTIITTSATVPVTSRATTAKVPGSTTTSTDTQSSESTISSTKTTGKEDVISTTRSGVPVTTAAAGNTDTANTTGSSSTWTEEKGSQTSTTKKPGQGGGGNGLASCLPTIGLLLILGLLSQ